MPVQKGFVAISGSKRKPARGAIRTGDADRKESFSVTIRVRRRPDGPPMPSLDELGKIPLNQRKFLSREEFAARHGASAEDLAAVTAFAAEHSLTVTDQSAGQRTVKVSGTVTKMEAAFGVKLGRYKSSTETYRGREGSVYVPKALGAIVESVLGLDNRRAVRPHYAGSKGIAAGATTPHNPPPAGTSLLTPPQVATLYNFPTNNANGQTVAILEFGGGYAKADITKFLQPLGISTPSIVDQSVDGGSNSPAGSAANVPAFAQNPDVEVALDIDVVASVAVGANIVMYFGPNNDQAFADAVSQAVHDTTHSPTIITCSWGGSEDGWTGSARNSMVTALNDAAALGVTVFFASGDDGADDGVGNGSAHIDYPGAEYGGICCGGTYIANVSGTTFTEGTWNDIGTSGGGVSDVYGLPAWQDNIGVPKSANDGTTLGRGVPDVSGNASPFSGYNLILYGTPTTTLATTSGPQTGFTYGSIAGTSAVAPLYASLLALIEAKIQEPLGYLTPLLYALQNDGPFVDINDGANNEWTNPPQATPPYPATPFYTCGPGWDACTGLGRLNGGVLLAGFQQVFAKSVSFKIEQSTFSQDEVELQLPGTATFPSYWVAVDGFRPSDLGINSSNLNTPPAASIPSLSSTFDPTLTGTESSALQAMLGPGKFAPPLVPQDPTLPNVPQRFLFPFTVSFNGDGGFLAMKNASPAIESTLVNLNAQFNGGGSNLTGASQLELTTGEDPRFEDIDPQHPGQDSWLSFDLRFFKMTVPPGQQATRFNATITGASDAPAFIAKAIGQLTLNLTGSDNFAGLKTDEEASALEFNPQDDSGNFVYNFALARVRLLAKSAATAKKVRVFFRLFQAQNTVSDFNTSSTYRYWSDGVTFGTAIPLAGVQADQNGNLEYITIPCFATERITLADPTKSMADQRDDPNAYDLPTDPGHEKDYYFGCWIDNNQTVGILPISLPNSGLPAAGKQAQPFDGPWGAGVTLGSMKSAMQAFPHQCMIAEIRYDDTPIPVGATSASSDKLAQRNIAWIDGPNPGLVQSARRVMHPVQLRPTPLNSPAPDELMILWGSTPAESQAQLYLPALDAEEMVRKAQDLYPVQQLGLVDAHTVSCIARGVTFLPLPEGVAPAAGLLSIDLPAGIKKGDSYSILVRQLTGASAFLPPPPPPPPPVPQLRATGTGTQVLLVNPPNEAIWQRVAGAFTFTINISTQQKLLLPEERLLAVLRWMLSVTPPNKRFYPVLKRYIGDVVGRVAGWGGNPEKIEPSPTGEVPGLPFHPGAPPSDGRLPHSADRLEVTGKIDGVIHDHFGDFSGFILETDLGCHHHFESRERPMLAVVERAWIERIRVRVIGERHRPNVPLAVILCAGGR
jgi:hypothetical protein